MNRRTFIELSSITALALTCGLESSCTTRTGTQAMAEPLFFSHLVDVKELKDIGKAYLQSHPSENGQTNISNLLLGSSKLTTNSSYETVQAAMDQQVKQDFKNGRILTINGWVLSVTEARQCALFSLLKA